MVKWLVHLLYCVKDWGSSLREGVFLLCEFYLYNAPGNRPIGRRKQSGREALRGLNRRAFESVAV